MKVLFCVDKTDDPNNEIFDGSELIAVKLDKKLKRRLSISECRLMGIGLLLKSVPWLLFLAVNALVVCSMILLGSKDALIDQIRSHPGFFVITVLIAILAIILFLFLRNYQSMFEWILILIGSAALLTVILMYYNLTDRSLSLTELIYYIPASVKLVLLCLICTGLFLYIVSRFSALQSFLLFMLSVALGFAAVMIFAPVDGYSSFAQRFAHSPGAFIFTVTGIIALMVCCVFAGKPKNYAEPKEISFGKRAIDKYCAVEEEVSQIMGYTGETHQLKILKTDYTRSGDDMYILSKSRIKMLTPAFVEVFADEECIYLLRKDIRIDLPRCELTGIRMMCKKVYRPLDILPYKDALIAMNKSDFEEMKRSYDKAHPNHTPFRAKPDYCALEMTHNGEEYALYFDPEEMEFMSECTGLKPHY